jgi:hypothetical protein
VDNALVDVIPILVAITLPIINIFLNMSQR